MLKPGGRFFVSVWDRLDDNPVPRITHDTVATFFPSDPPQFYTIPFSLHDVSAVRGLLESAGFEDVESERLAAAGTSPSASEAARGLIEGNPIYLAIMERRPSALADIEAAVAGKLRRRRRSSPALRARASSSRAGATGPDVHPASVEDDPPGHAACLRPGPCIRYLSRTMAAGGGERDALKVASRQKPEPCCARSVRECSSRHLNTQSRWGPRGEQVSGEQPRAVQHR